MIARPDDWGTSLDAAGARGQVDARAGMTFESSAMAYQAAIEGHFGDEQPFARRHKIRYMKSVARTNPAEAGSVVRRCRLLLAAPA